MWHFRNASRHHPDRSRLSRLCGGWLVLLLQGTACSIAIAQTDSSERPTSKPQASKSTAKTRKFVNKIPYDVFFDDPLQIVSTQTKPVATPPATSPSPGPAAAPPSKSTEVKSADASSATGWSKLIPIEDLQAEIKTMRNDLTKSLSNAGQYNQNFKVIAVQGGCVAALAVMAQQHEEGLSWKSNARYVRDFGAQINQAATGLGRDHFDQTRSAFQRLTSVLDGSVPADAGDVAADRPFQEVASRKSLMKRIERAKDWLKQDVNSEAKFKSMTDSIRHESAILAAFATAIATPGYEYTENEDYQNFARALIEGATEASSATTTESYDSFKSAIDKVNKSCTDCHSSYGNG